MSDVTTVPGRKDRTDLIVLLAGIIALVPTVVSAWGMLGVFLDMGLPAPLSFGTSFFLEGLLISMALLARRAIIHNRSARAEMALTWIASLVSGLLSAAHEFVGNGGHYVSPTLMTLIAVAVRIIAPLAAALLWHRVLVADEMDAMPEVPRHERRTQQALFQAICEASEVSSSRGEDRGVAMTRFHKAWRHAVQSSLTHWNKEELTGTAEVWVESLKYGDRVLLKAFTDDQTRVSVSQVPLPEPSSPQPAAPVTTGAHEEPRALAPAPSIPWTNQEDTAIFTNPFADETLQPITPHAPAPQAPAAPPLPTATGSDLRIAAMVVHRRQGTARDLANELKARGFRPPSNSTLRRALARAANES